jgi:hypothetical protein
LLDRAILNEKTSIDSDDKILWYIIIKDDFDNAGKYYSVGLSNYVTFDLDYELSNKFYYEIGNTAYAAIDVRTISTKSIEIIKVAGFPNCGKVDLYFPKYGTVSNFVSGEYLITSPNHGVVSGDRVKFTEALGSGTPLNGLKYAIPVDQDRFNIYYDKEFSYPAYIHDTYSSTGVRWSVVDGQTWAYGLTLYSPTDKNGYGAQLSLITSNEPSNTGETPLSRAVESSTIKPQADFTGQRSWTNYYPYERFDSTDGTVFGVVNGNKFGSSVSLKKYGNNYILMVAEEGASESFQLFSSFETSVDDYKPHNKKVVPSFLPYGKLHYFIVNPQTKSIEYLTTYSPSDNPWVSYEIVNRQERLIGQISKFDNKSLTTSDIATYNNTNSNYWNGARILQWSKDYFYNSEIGFSFPNQNAYPQDYGFVDKIKGADFEISGDTIYAGYVANVKNSDFFNNLRLLNVKINI